MNWRCLLGGRAGDCGKWTALSTLVRHLKFRHRKCLRARVEARVPVAGLYLGTVVESSRSAPEATVQRTPGMWIALPNGATVNLSDWIEINSWTSLGEPVTIPCTWEQLDLIQSDQDIRRAVAALVELGTSAGPIIADVLVGVALEPKQPKLRGIA